MRCKKPIKYASSGVVFGSQFSIFRFLAMIFALLVSGYPMELHSKVHVSKSHHFLKFCNFIACAKTLLNTPHLGWCSAVNFWRNSTRFAGFLAMIFTSKWLLASRNHWGLRNAKKILQKFINFEKILEISEKFSIIFVVFRISNGITLKRQSIFNFFLFLAVIFAFLVSGFPTEIHSEVHFFKIS